MQKQKGQYFIDEENNERTRCVLPSPHGLAKFRNMYKMGSMNNELVSSWKWLEPPQRSISYRRRTTHKRPASTLYLLLAWFSKSALWWTTGFLNFVPEAPQFRHRLKALPPFSYIDLRWNPISTLGFSLIPSWFYIIVKIVIEKLLNMEDLIILVMLINWLYM